MLPSGAQAAEDENVSGWSVTYYSAKDSSNLGTASVFVSNTYGNGGLDVSRISSLEENPSTAFSSTSVSVNDPFGYIIEKTIGALSSADQTSLQEATDDEKMKIYPLLQKVQSEDVTTNNMGIFLSPSTTPEERNKKAVISTFNVKDGMDVVISPTTTGDNSQVDVTGKITVEAGGRLAMMSQDPAVSGTVTFDEPIEVNNGGLLVFDTGSPAGSSVNYTPIKYTADSDNPIATINEGGKAYFNVGTLNLPDNAQSAAIKVDGGEVTINPGSVRAGAEQEMFNVFDLSLEKDTWTSPETLGIASASTSKNVPLVEVTTGELTVRGGQFASSGSESAIKATGGTVTLEDGSVTSSVDGVPAISVGAGATVVIPETSTTKVSAEAEGSNQAVSLAAL